jgi:hypothetical protein
MIAAAAVHSGALRLGESGYVRVTVLSGQQSYQGSEQNGVKSGDAENDRQFQDRSVETNKP